MSGELRECDYRRKHATSDTRPLRCKLDNQIDGKIIYIEIAGGGVAACNVTTMDVLATMSLRDNVVAGVGLTGNVTGLLFTDRVPEKDVGLGDVIGNGCSVSNVGERFVETNKLGYEEIIFVLITVPGIKKIFDRKLMNIQALEILRCICKEISTLDDLQIKSINARSAVFEAIKYGNIEFIVEIIKHCPHLTWSIDVNNRGIFFASILHRQERIFNFLYEIGAHKREMVGSLDKFHNSSLHLAGMIAPSSQLARVSGAALQMQHELQWFKEVENITQPKYKEWLNIEGKTPRALFTEEHKNLVKEGEKWMKDTASSSMVVATLIATVMFAAAFTVPGGNNGNTGIPIFLGQKSFMVYIVSDALSLFSSATSVLMFLGILTSRYAEDDFLKTLPRRLIIGLATLFFSIVTMMIAFGATLVIVLHERLPWVVIPVSSMACVPITLFASLQFPLLVDIVYSTYGPGLFNRKRKTKRSNLIQCVSNNWVYFHAFR
ncbi:hypothetical protein HHK36_030514 [Tetracentron sinense]|uniref:PGG domain-containing protein n=1 Tax=Tetracentron sinense TaxID=13715 RepID=A0A835D0Q3_TETSI|nr:hypothetical protein HHK36_030514 [Tetracentron sinense]